MKTNSLVVIGAAVFFSLSGFAFQMPSGLASSCSADATVLKAAMPVLLGDYSNAHPHAAATVMVTVGADGSASDVKVVSATEPIIAKAAVKAASESTYKPEMRNCKAVAGGQYLFHVVSQ